MGNRANIVVKSGGDQVCLYTHWGAGTLEDDLRSALIRGKDRWGDYQYLTRIIFSELIRNDVLGLTGFGISASVCDGGDFVIRVDCDRQTVKVLEREVVSFSSYVESGE